MTSEMRDLSREECLELLANNGVGRVAVSGLSKATDRALGAALGLVEAVLLISAAIVILDTYFGPGAATTYEGLGFLKQLSASLDASTIGQILRDTTVPFVVAVLGPLLPKDVTDLLPAVPTLPNGVPLPSP